MAKFRITPIGTCRIHSPLRRAAARYPVEIDDRRNYGFVHTSDEALQLVRFLQGDKQFSPAVAPVVVRDSDLAHYEGQDWSPSDLHIVEISSAKRITSGDDSVQGNYLSHHFADFFASKDRSRKFWSLVKRTHHRDLIEFLRAEPTYRLMSREDRELLGSLQMEPQSFKAIKTDMAEIVERLGRERLLFVTHVNANTPDDEHIPARDRLIRWVKMAAEELQANVFDPTAAMHDLGQEKALESGGLDLTHYTPAFSDRVYDEIHRLYVAPQLGAATQESAGTDADAQIARQAARLEATLELGDFFVAAREIHAAAREAPDALPLVELRGLVRSRIGDFPGAVEDLTCRGDDSALSQAMRVGLVEALNATGDAKGALRVAEHLLAEEFESSVMYRAAAEAAEKLGRWKLAILYAKQAFRKDRDDLGAALHALLLLGEHGSPEESGAWRSETLENIGASANGAFEICMWAIRNRDEELFAAALQAVAVIDKGGTIDLFEDAFRAGLFRAAAKAFGIAAELGRLPRSMSERRLAVIEGTLAEAESLAGQGQTAQAYELASEVLALDGISNSQIPTAILVRKATILIRDMAKDLRISIRDAFKDQDMDQALKIGEAAGDLLYALPDDTAVYARALHARGRSGEALAVMKRTLSIHKDSFIALRWAARFAAISEDYASAIRFYGDLRRSEDPEAEKIGSEIDRFFSTVEGRAMKQLRRTIVAGDYREATELADLIRGEVGAEDRVEREVDRMHGLLRRRLKEIEQGAGEPEGREPVLRQLLQIRPDDPVMLRRFALEMMRQFRFAEAAEAWGRIQKLEPDNSTAARQKERCSKMARRRVAAWKEESGPLT